jgi:hypothetical protein
MHQLLILAAVLAAGYPAPGLDVHSNGREVLLTQFDEFRPGPLRVHLSVLLGTKEPQRYVIAKLHEGVDAAQAAAVDTRGLTDVRELEEVATLVSGAEVRPYQGYLLDRWFAAGRYVVLNEAGSRPYAAFEVSGTPRDERLRRPTARLRVTDTGFRGPTRLDDKDDLRIDNVGERPHRVLGVRLRRGLTTAQAERKVRRGVDPDRLGFPTELLGVVSGGTSNRVLLDLRPGRYLLVSTYRADIARGLVRAVSVR